MFWPGEKNEQSQAYAKRATGDYLWQVDVDEFYKPEDMDTVLAMLQEDPTISAVSFRMLTFWGGFDYTADGSYLHRGASHYHRLFKWGPGYQYTGHRPPTVNDDQGRNVRLLNWVPGEMTVQKGIALYHYSLLFPGQVRDKCAYYSSASWAEHARQLERWMHRSYLTLQDPWHVHNVYRHASWLNRFRGTHPPQVQQMRIDIASGLLHHETRPVEDIERLLSSPGYRAGKCAFKAITRLTRSMGIGVCDMSLPAAETAQLAALGRPAPRWMG